MAAFALEAENFNLNSGYITKVRDFASNNQLIHLTELTGKATTSFNEVAGTYDVDLTYYDELDGAATVKLTIGNNEQTITLNQDLAGSRPSANNKTTASLFQGLQINPGDNIEITAAMDGGETAAIDQIEFTPVVVDTTPPTAALTANGFDPDLNSTDPYTFTVTFGDNEAVDISTLNNAITVQDENAVNQTIEFIGVDTNSNGSPRVATYRLNAPGGSWDLNEAGTYTVSVAANTVVDTSSNALVGGTLGSFEVDVQPDTSGDTKSYSLSNQAILARLDQDFAIQLEYGSSFSFMPLGDSITAGKEQKTSLQDEEDWEGYRRFLYEDLSEIGLDVDFVGSQFNGEAGFDRDNQGHSGWKVNEIADGRQGNGGVDVWIPDSDPDIVLLKIGTNNSGQNGSTTANQLNNLVGDIFDIPSFDGHLIVSTVAPIHPNSIYYDRTSNLDDYNDLIPGIVDDYQALNENISFVDIREGDNAITENDMTAPPLDNGLHPTADGYEKMANSYFDAVLDAAGTKETFSNVTNIVGSNFDDVIFGNDSPNEILGGEGDDELTGGAGADEFIYTKLADGSDILTDFNPAEGDIFQINATGFVGSGLTAGVALSDGSASATGVFVAGENPQPVGNSANILYDTNTGILSMDIDGVGGQSSLELATLVGIPTLGVDQFEIA